MKTTQKYIAIGHQVFQLIDGVGKEVVADLFSTSKNIDEANQRALLFAAAPDLLEALSNALEALESAQGNINPERGFADEVEAEVSAAIDKTRTAIAKATGSAS